MWQTDYDIYGNLRNLKGDRNFIPFRQLGQIEDEDTGLYYNRFRWYSADTGLYLSQDPIGLAGNNPTFYGYTIDTNSRVDIWGLSDCRIKFKPNKKNTYKEGEMSVLKHILMGHRLSSLQENTSKYLTDSPKIIKKLINEAISNGVVDEAGNSLSYTFSKYIGTDLDGNLTKNMKIYISNGFVRTAFPIK